MRRDVRCPVCGKVLCRAKETAGMAHDPGGELFLWCRGCRAEIPFRYVRLAPRKPNTTDIQSH